ncbi:MAG: hypothetical protein QHH75_05510 [Bacillota bacterium]|jgi:hypothetical protein|nr:hypothetical protein [Bacillota bacterium]
MNGPWHDEVRRVLRLDEEEIAFWERIAEQVPTRALRQAIRMMIRREREEMETLRGLLRDPHHLPGSDMPGFDTGAGYDSGLSSDSTTYEEKK